MIYNIFQVLYNIGPTVGLESGDYLSQQFRRYLLLFGL